MSLPHSASEISQNRLDEALELLRPKGSQPADDEPIAVITIFKSGFVQTMAHPTDAPFNEGAVRRWIAGSAQLAGDSILGLADDDEACNILLIAPETPVSLAEARAAGEAQTET